MIAVDLRQSRPTFEFAGRLSKVGPNLRKSKIPVQISVQELWANIGALSTIIAALVSTFRHIWKFDFCWLCNSQVLCARLLFRYHCIETKFIAQWHQQHCNKIISTFFTFLNLSSLISSAERHHFFYDLWCDTGVTIKNRSTLRSYKPCQPSSPSVNLHICQLCWSELIHVELQCRGTRCSTHPYIFKMLDKAPIGTVEWNKTSQEICWKNPLCAAQTACCRRFSCWSVQIVLISAWSANV